MPELKIKQLVKGVDGENKKIRGKIHGIRYVDINGEPNVIAYVVDTGKPHKEYADQPELVDIEPSNIEAV